MSKRRKPGPIFLEWDRLVFGPRLPDGHYPPDVESAWLKLWNEHIAGECFADTNVDDAALLCSLGWEIAVEQEDWVAAIGRLERWFEHPNAETADVITRSTFRCWVALAHLLSGEMSKALCLYQALLDEPPATYGRGTLYEIRNQLHRYSHEQPADTSAPAALARMVADVARRFRGRKRLATSIEPGVTSYGQLAGVLAKTYPA